MGTFVGGRAPLYFTHKEREAQRKTVISQVRYYYSVATRALCKLQSRYMGVIRVERYFLGHLEHLLGN